MTTFPTEQDKIRLTYLMDQYKLYHGHINTMFNYFLIASGLIVNAYVAVLNSTKIVSANIPTAIGLFGFVLAIVLWLVHRRSRALLNTIEEGLRKEEGVSLEDK